jgi:hypothetical protein
LIIPFGLTNVPCIFMRLMNSISHAFIGRFIVVYFNDILVYNKSLDEHINYLRYVLDVLRNEKLYVNLKKCIFCMDNFFFLGNVVSAKGIEMVKKIHENCCYLIFYSIFEKVSKETKNNKSSNPKSLHICF